MSRLSDISVMAFDMDGTLYQYSKEFNKDLRDAQAEVLLELSEGTIQYDEAFMLCQTSYEQFGSGWVLPAEKLKLSPTRLHELFHIRARTQFVTPMERLRETFVEALEAGLLLGVITHSHMDFARRVLERLNILDHINPEYLITLEQVEHREKHYDPEMFHEIRRRTGKPYDEIIVVEDSLKNLIHAANLHMPTTYIHWGKQLEILPSHAEFQHETPVHAMRDTIAQRSGKLIVQ